jgi:glycine cleavage system H lipoate-binding protein
MKCPFLEEMMVKYCKACNIKKMLPTDSLMPQNPCEGQFDRCAVYQEILSKNKKSEEAKMAGAFNKNENKENGESPCIWMKAGVIAYRMCTKDYDCRSCDFDQAIVDSSGAASESPMIVQAINKLRQLPAIDRKCRYALTGDLSYKLCPNNYECYHCAVDQYMQDVMDSNPVLRKKRERLARAEKKIKGFTVRDDVYYLPNHVWLKVEGEHAKVGIDDFAARIIGKINRVQLAEKSRIGRAEQCWGLSSGHGDVLMKLGVDAEVVEKNAALNDEPALVNSDPYNKGWLLKIKVPTGIDQLTKGSSATGWLEKEFEKLHQDLEQSAGITITDGGELIEDLNERISADEWRVLIDKFLR